MDSNGYSTRLWRFRSRVKTWSVNPVSNHFKTERVFWKFLSPPQNFIAWHQYQQLCNFSLSYFQESPGRFISCQPLAIFTQVWSAKNKKSLMMWEMTHRKKQDGYALRWVRTIIGHNRKNQEPSWDREDTNGAGYPLLLSISSVLVHVTCQGFEA